MTQLAWKLRHCVDCLCNRFSYTTRSRKPFSTINVARGGLHDRFDRHDGIRGSAVQFLSYFLGFTLLYLLLMPASMYAQELPSTAQGLTPYGSFLGSDIDSVILPTGKLNLHVPLISYPQRGATLHVGFAVEYANFYYEKSVPKPCNPDTNPNCANPQTMWSLNPLGVATGV